VSERRADQWLPAAHYGDAIGDEALRFRDVLRQSGFRSEVYALDVDEEVRGEVLPFESYPESGTGDLTILHFALPSPMTDAFRNLSGRKLIIYHNITPASYFLGLDDELVRIACKGREELQSLAESADFAVGDSEFNRAELESMGYRRTGVCPILLNFDRYTSEPNPILLEMLDDTRTNVLFVGRVYPNKRFEDLVRLAFFYKKYVSENFRFLLVGRAGRMLGYQHRVEALAHYWGLRPSELAFTGHLSWDDLLACYHTADVFVSMSEHEGFAVPLVESMLLDVPVMAYAAGAIPDTLGDAGVLFHEKKFEELAEMIYLLASDRSLRDAVVSAQRKRLERFRPERVESELLGYVEEVCR
jgi:glycosyltransferase involved in cell wall biosynthesis